MIVLGIDPGSRITGFGVVEIKQGVQTTLTYGTIRPEGKEHALRLAQIYEGVIRLLETAKPDACAIEMPIYARNAQSMLKLGRAQAAAMIAALNRQVPVFEYTPKEVKKSVTGNGNATKVQVWYMVKQLLALEEDRGMDASDALSVALCHAHRLGNGAGNSGPKTWLSYVRDNPDRVRS